MLANRYVDKYTSPSIATRSYVPLYPTIRRFVRNVLWPQSTKRIQICWTRSPSSEHTWRAWMRTHRKKIETRRKTGHYSDTILTSWMPVVYTRGLIATISALISALVRRIVAAGILKSLGELRCLFHYLGRPGFSWKTLSHLLASGHAL